MKFTYIWNNFRQYLKTSTRKLRNYLIFMTNGSKIVKKCLRSINLQVVSKDKCNNGIKREKSTGNLSIIYRANLI